MNIKKIDGRTFIRGQSKSNHIAEGGFSRKSYGLNLRLALGALGFIATPTDRHGSMSGYIIAHTPKSNGNIAFITSTKQFGYFVPGSDAVISSTGSLTYTHGKSDILITGTKLTFVTSTTNIGHAVDEDLSSVDEDYWTAVLGKSALGSSYPHPMIEMEGLVFIANGPAVNVISVTGSITGQENAVPNMPKNVIITEWAQHSDGVHIIAFCKYSDTVGQGCALIIDPVTLKWISRIDGLPVVDGVVQGNGLTLVTYGDKLGQFTGSTVSELLIFTDTSVQVFSSQMAFDGVDFIISDGSSISGIYRFGDLGAGMVFWRVDNEGTMGMVKAAVMTVGNRMYTSGTNSNQRLLETDFDTYGKNGKFVTDPITDVGRVWLRKVQMEFDQAPNDTDDTKLFIDVFEPQGDQIARAVLESNGNNTTRNIYAMMNHPVRNPALEVTPSDWQDGRRIYVIEVSYEVDE